MYRKEIKKLQGNKSKTKSKKSRKATKAKQKAYPCLKRQEPGPVSLESIREPYNLRACVELSVSICVKIVSGDCLFLASHATKDRERLATAASKFFLLPTLGVFG